MKLSEKKDRGQQQGVWDPNKRILQRGRMAKWHSRMMSFLELLGNGELVCLENQKVSRSAAWRESGEGRTNGCAMVNARSQAHWNDRIIDLEESLKIS